MRVVVTGGAGFIGSHLVDARVSAGDEVVVLDNLATGYETNVNPNARLVIGDITDPDTVASALDGAELVFHLAAARAVLRSVQQPLSTDRNNTAGTLAVLEASRHAGVRRVISTSSSSVYGGAEVTPTPESAPLVPRSPYAVSKLAGEHYARVYWELHGLETVVIRLFNVFGPRQRPDSQYAAVIPIFIDAIEHRRAVEIHGDGKQSRDFTYIEDAVAGYLAAARAPTSNCAGRTYNIAGGGEHTVLELLYALEAIMGGDARAVHADARPGDVRRSRADCSAAAADLGWSPHIDFVEGLARTVAWSGGRSDGPAGGFGGRP
jgi:UDP-glucose 4-epimerase